MTRPRPLESLVPGLLLGLAIVLSATPTLRAQPLSSGSGAGTGTGASGGATRNSTGTGLETGATPGTGLESGASTPLPGSGRFDPMPRGPLPRIRPGSGVSAGPGVGVTYPNDPPSIPIDSLGAGEGSRSVSDLSKVTRVHLDFALRIPDPGERSLTLSRIANAASFANQPDLAEEALDAANSAASGLPPGLVHDQRLISIVSSLLRVADDRLLEGTRDPSLMTPGAADTPVPALPKADNLGVIRKARRDLTRAAELAPQIGNPTFRNEELARVATAFASASQRIISEFVPAQTGEVAKPSPAGKSTYNQNLDGLPDALLRDAAALAGKIDRPVWHDEAIVAITAAAADSLQFARALEIARLIPLPEVRTNALIKLAETQARRGDPDGATVTYREAALAVASIPESDPRGVLAGVLIDNLIAVGRFEDARAAIALYGDNASRRRTALGAVAESQGRRGAARSALTWINAEIPQSERSWLYRRVNSGVVSAIEDNRGKDLSNRRE